MAEYEPVDRDGNPITPSRIATAEELSAVVGYTIFAGEENPILKHPDVLGIGTTHDIYRARVGDGTTYPIVYPKGRGPQGEFFL